MTTSFPELLLLAGFVLMICEKPVCSSSFEKTFPNLWKTRKCSRGGAVFSLVWFQYITCIRVGNYITTLALNMHLKD
uniref:Putative secreted protein n=1 Tax=Ixodes ricinus TaxID=34613 RepID=A0A6B0TUF5_IXORI